MSRISEKFRELRGRGETALIPYIMAGDPDLKTTEELIFIIDKSGADMIELGVPFSDPLADGPTIQKAAIRALGSGTHLSGVFGLVKGARKHTEIPIILMLYYNLVLKYGEEKFARDAARAGVDGVIIPDLPPDEAAGMMAAAKAFGLNVIFLLAPTSSDERIRLVERSTGGFIYYVSMTGVTGKQGELDKGIEAQMKKIRRLSKKPVCVGFGISSPEQAAKVASWADGVIVGSAIVRVMEGASGRDAMLRGVGKFVKGLKEGVLSVTAG
ncbi:MAG: tryptophan synthase subunit alpha [Nitrospirae bacterium]|nr:tryptophan synthase subunit alpha [Nitrospirota bacterium]